MFALGVRRVAPAASERLLYYLQPECSAISDIPSNILSEWADTRNLPAYLDENLLKRIAL
jgi:hypothetical protein